MGTNGYVTAFTLAEQMQLHELEIANRKDLLDFGHEDICQLTKLHAYAEHCVCDLVEEFYAKQIEHEAVAVIIGDADTLARLKSVQCTYILDLFSGEYDKEYVNNRLRIGMVHKRIGVDPKYYLSAMFHLKRLLVDWVRTLFPEEEKSLPIVRALDKLLNFDTQLVFDTYISSLVSEIELSRHQVEHYVENLERIVHERTKQLEELSQKDHLTGLFNRRTLDLFVDRFIANASRQTIPVSLLYFDVDNFKQINDSHGHQVGDRVLMDIGRILLRITRLGDIPCRMGGDEFCMLMFNSSREDARCLVERLFMEIDNEWEGAYSISVGQITTGPDQFDSVFDLLRHVDKAMYAAKKIAGNSLVDYQDLSSMPVMASLRKRD